MLNTNSGAFVFDLAYVGICNLATEAGFASLLCFSVYRGEEETRALCETACE